MFMAMPDASGKLSSSVTSVASVASPFPIEVLPPILKQMVEEVAQVATVPHTLPACQALAIVSAALGSGLAIPSDRERTTFGNLYLIPAAESGSGKSVTFKSMMAPVYEYQDKLRVDAKASHCQLKAEMFKLKRTLKRAKSDELSISDDELAEVIGRLDYIEKALQKWPKIVCEDVTQAKLQVLLASNHERILSASADARQVVHAVLSGKGDNLYLKGWSGDPTDVDRISRNEVPLRGPRMSVLWCPQPDLLMEMFTRRVLTENGFLPRVLPCLIDTAPMCINIENRRVSDATENAWHDLVRDLFTTFHSREGEPVILRRSIKVLPVLVDYYNGIVERRRNELADVSSFAARWAEYAWRLVVVLHAGTYGPDAHKVLVTAQTAKDAIVLMKFFSEQQLDLLRRSRAHAKTEAEQAIFDALALRREITVREVQLGALRKMNADQIRQVLEQLVAAGKLSFRVQKAKGVGRDMVFYFRSRDTCDTGDTGPSLRPEIQSRRQG